MPSHSIWLSLQGFVLHPSDPRPRRTIPPAVHAPASREPKSWHECLILHTLASKLHDHTVLHHEGSHYTERVL